VGDVTGDCAAPRIALGAYVLGALDPADRSALETHLAGCATCQAELASLAGLPGLLGRLRLSDVTDVTDVTDVVGVADVADVADVVGPTGPTGRADDFGIADHTRTAPTGGGAERALAAVNRARRVARRRMALGATAIAAAVAAVAVGITIAASPGSNDRPPPAGRMLTATGATSRVEAWVWMAADPAGTAFTVRLANVPPGSHCVLVAQAVDGHRETAASWAANYDGGVEVRGTAGIGPASLDRLLVLTDDGRQLVVLPAHAA
jgi:hypothetical protein